MKFYTKQHPYYCGIDLHARSLYVCILDQAGDTCVHKEISANPDKLYAVLEPYLGHIVVGVECMHSTLSPDSFYLLHPCSRAGTGWRISVRTSVSSSFSAMRCICAPFMVARPRMTVSIDRQGWWKCRYCRSKYLPYKIATLIRGGNFPLAYVYPKAMRATRDLLRRRMKLVRHGADLKAHVANTTSQYNLPPNKVNLKNVGAREQLKTAFPDLVVQKNRRSQYGGPRLLRQGTQ